MCLSYACMKACFESAPRKPHTSVTSFSTIQEREMAKTKKKKGKKLTEETTENLQGQDMRGA